MPHRIYFVEDHPVMRYAVTRLLEREADIELIGVAVSGEEALATFDGAAGDRSPDGRSFCDLVVTNVSLPGMDGFELTERLLAGRPSLKVLMVSGNDEAVFMRRALETGAHRFLSKRDLAVTLPGAIREALGGGRGDGEAG